MILQESIVSWEYRERIASIMPINLRLYRCLVLFLWFSNLNNWTEISHILH